MEKPLIFGAVELFYMRCSLVPYPLMMKIQKGKLQDKYGTNYKEYKNVKDGEGYVRYATDYIVWETDPDEITGETNRIVLTKCNYNGSSPFVISYIDSKNSKVDTIEINSDF